MARLLVLGGTFYIVNETNQVIITQFGEPVGDPITEPGLKFKVPFIQKLHRFDKRFLEWDGEPTFQSMNRDAQDAAVDELLKAGLAYRCGCSRRDLSGEPHGPLGTIYPGTCRSGS